MKGIKIIAVIGLALLVLGFATCGEQYTEQVYRVRLRPGETIEGVSERYFDEQASGECWDAYRWRQLEANKHLWANDRWPQIGDDVTIIVRVKK